MCYKKGDKNIIGTELVPCSLDPITGFYRDGYCKSFDNDPGQHTVCAKLTTKFLMFSKELGNDLITPRPEYQFLGLKEGDAWCLCADRWLEAFSYNVAPNIYIEATHISFLEKIEFEKIKNYFVEFKNAN
ncbi:MAG: hypothetical protein CFH34_00062 [Alphaproteobacteria bacterium MarineAlpha9_Bin4]|nr:hypothetical protein [Pelagibacterales bacterium]PPR27582.1 MAG: hypothetical protein CFH34_00062 [Alphaproteobacteria bacterium MarineAlpha9_Bin4]|tara:strand:+ start:990 stop:1379 length:390 start_codon:yes stop_codon:yes gene_type:complete